MSEQRLEFSGSVLAGVEIKRCRNSPHEYKPHIHNELSLGYIAEGSTDLTLHDDTLRFEAGDGVVIPPLMTHRCAPKDIRQWEYVMLFVDPGYYEGMVSFRQARRLTGAQAGRVTGFIAQLLEEKTPDTVETILIELLLEFGDPVSAVPDAAGAARGVALIHDYILAHAGQSITLDDLQELSGLNKFAIIRGFKRQYVTTPAAYHLQYRVAQAKRLLSDGLGVFDVCERLRFYDQAHLIREFKRMYGVTPASYLVQRKG